MTLRMVVVRASRRSAKRQRDNNLDRTRRNSDLLFLRNPSRIGNLEKPAFWIAAGARRELCKNSPK